MTQHDSMAVFGLGKAARTDFILAAD